jgi:acyl transferase domain-containing protein/acyl carrier protein
MTTGAVREYQLTPLQRAALTIKQLRRQVTELEQAAAEPIAIVGMGCRFPGDADTPDRFWDLLEQEREAISAIPPDRWDTHELYNPDPDAGGIYVRRGYFLREVDRFDPAFFGLSPREANSLDPQHRLLLEVAWEALEDAGQAPDQLAGSQTGVFVGIGQNDYAQLQLFAGDHSKIGAYDGTGNGLCFSSGRLAHILRLRGPNLAIDTACSSSLVAVHLACQSLRARECDTALAGGVQLILSPEVTLFLCRARALSPDGRCKAFDAAADGYGRGEGCGVVVLKRLSDALAAGDDVRAVVLGSAINHNGPSSGLTVPSGPAQQALLRRALATARLEPDALDYVEAHGTGTALGDPIEVQSLEGVFRGADHRLLIGSVKTNIGHLEAAAGIAGLIKVALALERGVVPASLHLRQPNPTVAWENNGIVVADRRMEWPQRGEGRVAGISSFGISGTNAHVILAAAPAAVPVIPAEAERPLHVFTASARTPEALREQASRIGRHIARGGAGDVADLCFTANHGRAQNDVRLALVVRDVEDLGTQLAAFRDAGPADGVPSEGRDPAPLAWLFTGQGSQYHSMAGALYRSQPGFRRTLQDCDEILRPVLSPSLLDVWFSPDFPGLLDQTCYAQPALFVLQCALSELWASWGIEPAALLGHSVGEYAAACRAGVFSLEHGLRLIAARGRLMQAQPGDGLMAAAAADHARVAAVIADTSENHRCEVAIAAVNGPRNTVISGRRAAVEAVIAALSATGIATRALQTSHAFHSPMMEGMLDAFGDVLAGVQFSPPRVPLVSSVTGTVGADVAIPEYWCRQVRQPVAFAAGMATLAARGCGAFLEIGPAPVLLGMGRQVVADQGSRSWLPSLRPGVDDWQQMLDSLAARFIAGGRVDWAGFDRDYPRRRVRLPTYPFQRQRYWVAGGAHGSKVQGTKIQSGAKGREPEAPLDALYRLSWHLAPQLTAPVGIEPGCWVVVADGAGSGDMVGLLERRGEDCLVIGCNALRLDATDLRRRIGTFAAQMGRPLRGVVYLAGAEDAATACQDVVAMAQALLGLAEATSARIWCVTRGAVPLDGKPHRLNLDHSALWGLGRSIALEHPALWGGLMDLDIAGGGDEPDRLLAELIGATTETQVALRHDGRRVPRLEAWTPDPVATVPWRDDASYLVTGGFGGIGLQLADWLVRRGAVHLVLVGRSAASDDAARLLGDLERGGARIRMIRADVADRAAMAELFARLGQEGPPLRGVFHAAGVAGAGRLKDLDRTSIAATLRPKVAGARLLDELTAGLDLDHFVCFSSIASLWGGRGQADYAAANQVLDALAHDRRARGLPALTVNWGPWTGAGMAVPEAREALGRMGIAALDAGQNLSALERLMGADIAQAAVAQVDWSILKALHQARGGGRFLERIAPPASAAPGPASGASPVLDLIRGAEPAARHRLLIGELQREVARILGYPDGQLPDSCEGFFQLGMDSLMALELRSRIGRGLGLDVPVALMFDLPTIEGLAGALLARLDLAAPAAAQTPRRFLAAATPEREPIAIVGIACRFPGGADSPEQFWRLLCEGRETVGEVPDERWDAGRHFDPTGEAPGTAYTRCGYFINDVDLFDAAFFGITPREAAEMDPQHRLLLELSHAALEDAGQSPRTWGAAPVGVFVGLTNNEYALLLRGDGRPERIGSYFVTGNALNAASGRISYALGLQGPSLTVDTACSSSLVAVHLACRSLLAGECDVAIAAGANLMLTQDGMIAACQARMLAADGRCKPFDESADGYGRGEGCGVVVLKPSSKVSRSERVWAVIRGTALNQDGRSSGFTVPNGLSQQQVLREALEQAGVGPDEVGYVEAHGTGTALGDPIEVEALGAVLGDGRHPGSELVIGSVKANIGHLESAAGIAGLIKTALVLHYGEIPRQPNLRTLSSRIAWDRLGVRAAGEHRFWPRDGGARHIAGVSAFGLSGTNAHAVLEEPPPPAPIERPRERPRELSGYLLAISAKTVEALRDRGRNLRSLLVARPELDVAELCFTCGTRTIYKLRAAWAVRSRDEAITALQTLDQAALASDDAASVGTASPPLVGFLLGGAVAASAGVGRALYGSVPAFRARLDGVATLLDPHLPRPLVEVLCDTDSAWQRDPVWAGPVTFSVGFALGELWQSWGISPAAVTGNGTGDLTAACLAGRLSLAEGAALCISGGSAGVSAALAAALAADSADAGAGRVRCIPARQDRAAAVVALQQCGCNFVVEIGSQAGGQEPGAAWLGMLASLASLFCRGAMVDFGALDSDTPHRVVSLPAYPFQRRRYWVATGTARQPPVPAHRTGAFVHHLRSAVAGDEIEFAAVVGTSGLPFLADHRVCGAGCVPSALSLELVFSAATKLLAGSPAEITNYAILKPAVLDAGADRPMHVVLRRQDEGGFAFRVLGADAGGDDWICHATGRLQPMSHAAAGPALNELRSRLSEAQPVERFYERLREHGIELGDRFRVLRRLWVRDGEALGELQLPQDTHDTPPFQVHPLLLEGCFQMLGAALGTAATDTLYLQTGIDRLLLPRSPGAHVFAHLRLRRVFGRPVDPPVGDLWIFAPDGTLVAAIEGLRTAAAEPAIPGALYRLDWETRSAREPDPVTDPDAPSVALGPTGLPPQADITARACDPAGRWLIFADRGGIGTALGRRLRARGAMVTLAAAEEPDLAPGYQNLIAQAMADGPLNGIVHLRSLDAEADEAAEPEALSPALAAGSRSALHLVQAIIGISASIVPLHILTRVPLHIVTRGAVGLGDSGSAAGLAQSPVHGLAKVLRAEHGELPCQLIDLDPGTAPDPEALLGEILGRKPEETAVVLRSGRRHVARLTRITDPEPACRPLVRSDRAYLVTGAFGGIGLHLTRWLLDQGARHLVLLGRHGPSAAAATMLRDAEKSGVQVLAPPTDVAHFEVLGAVLAEAARTMPPLAGMLHAAGLVADRMIADQEWRLFEQVFAPKVAGAWNLHRATRHLTLDFFVLFSSVSALLGGAGLSNYVAANAFLDAMAHYRRQRGLTALSIDWNPWADVGMARHVGAAREAEWKALGLRPLGAAEALDALSKAIEYGTTHRLAQIGVLAIDWARFHRHPARAALGALLQRLQPSPLVEPDPVATARRAIDAAIGPAEAKRLLQRHVRAELRAVLGWDSGDSLDSQQGFFDLGMDSLQANELRNRLQRTLGCALPPNLLFRFPTETALVAHLLAVVLGKGESGGRPNPMAVPLAAVPLGAPPFAGDGADDPLDERMLTASIRDELDQLERLLGND